MGGRKGRERKISINEEIHDTYANNYAFHMVLYRQLHVQQQSALACQGALVLKTAFCPLTAKHDFEIATLT